MPFRLSAKVTLNEGDEIRVSGGPYYLSRTGNKTSMGQSGTGKFVSVSEKGDGIFVQFPGRGGPKFVYIGPDGISETTGTILKAHKIVKVRKKK